MAKSKIKHYVFYVPVQTVQKTRPEEQYYNGDGLEVRCFTHLYLRCFLCWLKKQKMKSKAFHVPFVWILLPIHVTDVIKRRQNVWHHRGTMITQLASRRSVAKISFQLASGIRAKKRLRGNSAITEPHPLLLLISNEKLYNRPLGIKIEIWRY